MSDDGKEGRSEKRGEQSRHSGSPSRSGRDRDRDRDRDRSWGDRTKRERKYHRGKDSRHGRDRDGDRDHDSNADSSDDESPWSYRDSRRSKGYQSYQRGGRKSTYQSKYGQKHDRFGGGGRRDNTQQSNWNANSGRMNPSMTAQQFKKRREKGLSLLATPKIKPSDNLDQFNYPAPPSWYLEAVEKWERERGQDGKAASDQTGPAQLTAVEAPISSQIQPPSGITAVKPPPLFPPQQAQFPQPSNPTSASLFGEPPAGLPPIPGQVANIPPAMPIQVPSLFPPPTGTAIPPAFLPPHVAVNSTLQASQPIIPQGEQGENSLVIKGERGVVPTVQAVNVSSLPLNESSTEVEDEDEGGMKIALETPTPQPTADTKTFSLFKATEQEGEAIKEDNPESTSANDVLEKGSGEVEESSSNVCTNTKEDIEGEGMEVEVPPEKDKIQNVTDSQSGTSTVPSAAAPSSSSVAPPSDPAIITSSNTSSPATAANLAKDSPPNPPPVSVPTTGNEDSFAMKNSIGSDHEEDSDYDKYLDQLDEEEDQENIGGPSLVGVLSSNLLKNNPLDEDFPAINPVNESKGKEESLLSLLGESVTTDREERNFHGKAKGL